MAMKGRIFIDLARRLPFSVAIRLRLAEGSGKVGEVNRILYCGDARVEDEPLMEQLAGFGFVVTPVETLRGLKGLLAETGPGFVLLTQRWAAPDGDWESAVAAIAEMPEAARPNLVLVGEDATLPARLRAVRAGARAYLMRPLNPIDVVDRLEQLLEDRDQYAFRVMVVDDEDVQTKFYKAVLEQAGVRVLTVNDPMQVMSGLTDFRPELVMIDLYMPGVHGHELAAAIRQDPAHVSIPIVYLSSETDRDKQHMAMQVGGDDFLVKPMKAEHLVTAVRNRARRFRELRSLMLRDSLTGLLNQASTRDHLAVELSRMRRSDQPLAFAMIDIDHFKAVNDTYGHPTGDRVIRALANLLKQRLRTTDVIGRFGGEEFAVALAGTPPDAAFSVMEEIRRSFQSIEHKHDGLTFQCSISCGISCFPSYPRLDDLVEAADQALYTAKESGRNRVAMA